MPSPLLASHGRYDYSAIPDREPYDWPGGRRLAFYVGVNLEVFSFGEGEGPELGGPKASPDVMNYAWRDYGNRVGVWRILEVLDDLEIPAVGLANSQMIGQAPGVVEASRQRGGEVVAHGRTNAEKPGAFAERDEARLIADATDALTDGGERPLGWLAPHISESKATPDLLAEAGYEYLLDWAHDDQPVWMDTRGGRILSVPSVGPVRAPVQFADARRELGLGPLHRDARGDLSNRERPDGQRRRAERVEPVRQLGGRAGVDDAAEPGPAVRRRAHRAVLARGVDRRRRARVGVLVGGGPLRQFELRVLRRVAGDGAVAGLAEHVAVRPDQHGAERLVARVQGLLSQFDATAQVVGVARGHGRRVEGPESYAAPPAPHRPGPGGGRRWTGRSRPRRALSRRTAIRSHRAPPLHGNPPRAR